MRAECRKGDQLVVGYAQQQHLVKPGAVAYRPRADLYWPRQQWRCTAADCITLQHRFTRVVYRDESIPELHAAYKVHRSRTG